MIPVVTIEHPFNGVEMIKIFKPVARGIGGTMAFPVSINDLSDILEMNDECIWESTYKVGLLTNPVMRFINELIETVIIPPIIVERKYRNTFCGYEYWSQDDREIDFTRFCYNETDPGNRHKVLCKMNKSVLFFN